MSCDDPCHKDMNFKLTLVEAQDVQIVEFLQEDVPAGYAGPHLDPGVVDVIRHVTKVGVVTEKVHWKKEILENGNGTPQGPHGAFGIS